MILRDLWNTEARINKLKRKEHITDSVTIYFVEKERQKLNEKTNFRGRTEKVGEARKPEHRC